MSVVQPRPLAATLDQFVARAIITFKLRVEVLSALDALVYGGDDWPQPHPNLGMTRLPWEDWPPRESLIALRDRLRASANPETAVDRELYVCQGEDGGRCDLIGPYRGAAPRHYCNFDDDHEGPHECACGHQWTNNEEN